MCNKYVTYTIIFSLIFHYLQDSGSEYLYFPDKTVECFDE